MADRDLDKECQELYDTKYSTSLQISWPVRWLDSAGMVPKRRVLYDPRYSRTRRPAVSRWQNVIRGKIRMGRTVAVAVGVFFAVIAVVLLLLFPGVGDVLRWYSSA